MAKRNESSDDPKSRRAVKTATSQARKTRPTRAAAASSGKTARSRSAKSAGSARTAARPRRRAPAPRPAPVLPPLTNLQAMAASRLSQTPPPGSPPPVREAEPAPGGFLDRGMPVPDSYGFDRLALMVRDPQWVFCYWELHGAILPDLRAQRGQAFIDSCAWVLRLYRINEGTAVDMEIEPVVGNWYIHVGGAGKYQLELALLSPDGEWISLLVSEVVETPREGPAEVVDEEWRLRPEDEEALLHAALELADSRKRGVSGFLGASRLQSSFAMVSSCMFGGSLSGRPVAGSWGWSFVGASGRVSGSGSGSGGFGWLIAPSGVQEPVLERPMPLGGGPNWNVQRDLPAGRPGKTQQPHFKVKLPRTLRGLSLPRPTWPPRVKARAALRKAAKEALKGGSSGAVAGRHAE